MKLKDKVAIVTGSSRGIGARRRVRVGGFMKNLEKLAEENARQNPGISFSEKLIDMRYEQQVLK